MNRIFFMQIVAVFAILFFVAEASACGRCGRFGRSCHFAAPHVVHHAAPVVVPPSVTNFIFNNSYPGPILPPGGASLFGYSLSAQGQYIDPALVLDRSARIAEQEQRNTATAIAGFQQVAGTALALNDQFNQRANSTAIATVAISALQSNQTAAPQATALKVSINSLGETSTEWLRPDPAGDGQFQALGSPVVSLSCAKCHNADKATAPKGFVFDGKPMSRADFDWAAEQVWAGKMPPKANLDRAGKSAVVESLRAMVQ